MDRGVSAFFLKGVNAKSMVQKGALYERGGAQDQCPTLSMSTTRGDATKAFVALLFTSRESGG